MNKDLIAIFEYMEREKGIKRDVIIEAIVESLRVAAMKDMEDSANIAITIDDKTGDIEMLCEKKIVEKVEDSSLEISIEGARDLDPDCAIDEYIDCIITPSEDFGRIAAQKARQIITQKLRGAERNVIYEEYRHRRNEIISGTVKRFVRGSNIVVDLGKVEAILPTKEYPRSERYNVGDKLRALLVDVQDTENGGAEVVLSRSSPEFVHQLFIQEVPELSDGIVSIEKIVREAGYRTKLAVKTTDNKVDPVGACVGMRGSRVKNVIYELNNEKIDIVTYSEDPIELLHRSLDPIEILRMSVDKKSEVITIVVDDDNLAKVLGRYGMNTRLTQELIGYNIDAQKISDYHKRQGLLRAELLEGDSAFLDEPLSMEDINTLVIENMIRDGYDTMRKVLEADADKLVAIPGISLELADEIIDLIIQQRT
ncbi:MAG: transcription termination/antitermination protein NusA [Waddliaceae bacterium]|nr:transcription termination/antitermination protein NusA [Waddliaceae bacterium]MBT3579113.1 transcription termination/antitermination protein NusA [Waddliaceae bacterium]MBT4444906.1 transcription termination/antitermination protein NusA [Waddliaceae bacterium]MBT6927941.1 transcription termination/antitermination protein NusA [Waddliaceae bacterium]MBT7264807.1 transcription termination/antitermination protein NusA [Waddliaceae bacterium]